MQLVKNDNKCFVCGDDNKKGLQYRFWLHDNEVITKLKNNEEYIGHGAMHGGIAATLLDEAMGLISTIKKNTLCVTAEFTVRYLKPLTLEGKYTVKGRIDRDRTILCETSGEIIDEDLTVFVRATGKYVPIPREVSSRIHPDAF